MIESTDILGLMKILYIIYVTIVLLFVGMYALHITKPGRVPKRVKIPFYAWIAFLIFTGVGIHILTFNKIPWVKWEMDRDNMEVDRVFDITIADYKFQLPAEQLLILEGETIRFNLRSLDYTYGFGLFREDGTMVFQMQVVPGHRNDIVWKFDKSGIYTIRSTEYSGPKGGNLHVKNAVIVTTEQALARMGQRKNL